MESITTWPQHELRLKKNAENAYSQLPNATSLQTFLRRESLISSSPVSLLPPTRKRVRESKQLADGLMVSGENGDGEYYFRLGLWALHWLPAFIFRKKKSSKF